MSSCSQALGYCEVDNDQLALRRSSVPNSSWVVSVRTGAATAMPRVEEVHIRRDCCGSLVLVPGDSLKVLDRPDAFVVADAGKASALIRLLLAAEGEKVSLKSFYMGWNDDSLNTKGFAEALDWVDQQQGRTDHNRTAAAPPPHASEISPKIIADTDRFTDPERTIKELPGSVQRLTRKRRGQAALRSPTQKRSSGNPPLSD